MARRSASAMIGCWIQIVMKNIQCCLREYKNIDSWMLKQISDQLQIYRNPRWHGKEFEISSMVKPLQPLNLKSYSKSITKFGRRLVFAVVAGSLQFIASCRPFLETRGWYIPMYTFRRILTIRNYLKYLWNKRFAAICNTQGKFAKGFFGWPICSQLGLPSTPTPHRKAVILTDEDYGKLAHLTLMIIILM